MEYEIQTETAEYSAKLRPLAPWLDECDFTSHCIHAKERGCSVSVDGDVCTIEQVSDTYVSETWEVAGGVWKPTMVVRSDNHGALYWSESSEKEENDLEQRVLYALSVLENCLHRVQAVEEKMTREPRRHPRVRA